MHHKFELFGQMKESGHVLKNHCCLDFWYIQGVPELKLQYHFVIASLFCAFEQYFMVDILWFASPDFQCHHYCLVHDPMQNLLKLYVVKKYRKMADLRD